MPYKEAKTKWNSGNLTISRSSSHPGLYIVDNNDTGKFHAVNSVPEIMEKKYPENKTKSSPKRNSAWIRN